MIGGEVVALQMEGGRVAGVELADGTLLGASAVVLCTGTFLGGRLYRGEERMEGGRIGEAAAHRLAQQLRDAALPMARLKTGKKMLSVEIELMRGEGEIAELFGEVQKEFPDVSMGSYPFNREARIFGTQLVLRSTDPARLSAAEARLRERLNAKGIPN